MSETGFATSGGAQIYFEAAGSGPTVVLIHAGIADSRMWDQQFDLLARDFRVVRLDLRGFGRSEFVPEPFAARGDILAVLDHLQIPHGTLVGCSMGGGIALELAIESPDRVSRLVLVASDVPGFVPEGLYQPPQWEEGVKAFEAGDMERVAELEAEVWVVGYGRTLDDVDRMIFDLVVEMDRTPLETETARSEYESRLEPKVAERLGEVNAPALIVLGDRDMPDLLRSSAFLKAGLDDVTMVTIADAAHLPSLEKPKEFNAALLAFLNAG